MQYYLNNNADLKTARLSYQQAFQHYVTNGLKEERVARAGLINAGSNNDQINMSLQIFSSNKTPNVVIYSVNSPHALVPGSNYVGFPGPNFSYIVAPGVGIPAIQATWTSVNTDGVYTVTNNTDTPIHNLSFYNSYYPIGRFANGFSLSDAGGINASGQNDFKPTDVAGSISDIFGIIQYDPYYGNGELNFISGNKTGLLPHQSMDIVFHFTVPQDLSINHPVIILTTPS